MPTTTTTTTAPVLDRKSFFGDLADYQEKSANQRDWVPPADETLIALFSGVNFHHAEDSCVFFFKFAIIEGEYDGKTFSIRQSTKAGWVLDKFLAALLPADKITSDWSADIQAAEKVAKKGASYFQVETSERDGSDGKTYPDYAIEPIEVN
jgi:hypothetical protein